jgi:hypothetical protein
MSFIVCVALCAVFCLSVECYFVLCLILVPLPPDKTPFAAEVNNVKHEYQKEKTIRLCGLKRGRRVMLTILPPFVSRSSRKFGILKISQPHRPPLFLLSPHSLVGTCNSVPELYFFPYCYFNTWFPRNPMYSLTLPSTAENEFSV